MNKVSGPSVNTIKSHESGANAHPKGWTRAHTRRVDASGEPSALVTNGISLPNEFVCICGQCKCERKDPSRFHRKRYFSKKNSQTSSDGLLEDKFKVSNETRRHVKAGAFIFNQTSDHKTFVLLVQSHGRLWGPPKGSSEPEESVYQCAIREVREETGIDLEEVMVNMLVVPCILVKSRIFLYKVNVSSRLTLKGPSYAQVVEGGNNINDATSVGWFSTECIMHNVAHGKFPVNRLLLCAFKKFLRLNISLSNNHKCNAKNEV